MPSRRRAPTIMLTATVATVLILPWATDSAPGDKPPDAAATRLTQQPLPALGAGRTVREIIRDEPFSMVALTGADLTGTSTQVRAKRADGSWGPWYQAEHETGPGGPPGGPDGTEPVFVGATTAVQIAITRPAGAKATPPPNSDTPVKPDLGYRPATAEQPFPQNISAVLMSPPRAPVDVQWTPPTAVLAPGQPPAVIPRAHWGAAASNRCGRQGDGSPVHAAVVHHTAGSNDYTPEDSAGIVRSIYAYHTRMLGWCDIGYNALVDKYGQVFEGRGGGISKPIVGTHAGGFNRNTWGVSMIGTFDHTPPPPIQLHTVGRLLGWRLGLDRTDPHGKVQLVSAGGSYTSFARGATLTLPTIFSHRDVDKTECPGDAGYAALAEIRDIAARFNEPPG
ncbi:MAG TPA: N-acetylmuramoyl-L-alanine amidase, partial [Mycobacterium sp.]|nr:N-acetylmuramoyl-L-alanine amidase [Mycobacterium sp.]